MFAERLAEASRRCGAAVCVGLDPHHDQLPASLLADVPPTGPERRVALAQAAATFCVGVVQAVAGVVPAVKPQVAFFEALGSAGAAALELVVGQAKAHGLLVVLDAKRGDIGSTAEAYAVATLDDDGPLAADALTVSPYLGPESLAPFVARCPRKGLFVLVRTSNPGSGAWQVDRDVASGVAAWVEAESAARVGPSGLGPVGAVVAATVPAEAARWRAAMPHAWLLVPGYGAQGGTADDVRALVRPDGTGALVTASRSVLFGNDRGDFRDGVRRRSIALVGEIAALRR